MTTLAGKIIRKLRMALAQNASVTKEWLERVVMVAKKIWVINLEMLASQMKALYRERKIWHVGMHTQLQKVWSSIH